MSAALESLVSPAYLRRVVERLESFRSHPLGFRVAGTPEERRTTAWIAGEMRAIGLRDVVEEPVPVDAWRLREAWVETEGGARFECASMAGVPETPRRGVSGELAVVRRGGRRELEGVEVAGRVVLVDWSDGRLWPYEVGLELGLRGAAALIVACLPGGPYFQEPGALGAFDAMWHREAPPMVTIRSEDAAAIAALEGRRARVGLRAPLTPGAEAANVLGVLPGHRPGAPIVVGGHHDAWFSGAFDDATGVAATLALARAFVESGTRPRHPIAFVSHTAEEYGIAWSRYDWCYGAWWQIVAEHREWAARSPFYLNVEGSGLPVRLEVDPPPELAAWVRRVCRRAARDGLLPHGFSLGPANTLTEVWTFLAAGVPAINVSSFTDEWIRTRYHTQHDTSADVDFDYLAKLTRVYARLVLDADAAPDAILDYRARGRDLRRALAPVPAGAARERLERSLARLDLARGRAAFTAIGRGLHGLTAHGAAAYPHEQAATDVRELEAALAALHGERPGAAARHLSRVGMNDLCADLSAEAFALERARQSPGAGRLAWAAQGQPSPGPSLWAELASLHGEPGARPPGPWLEQRLERHLARSRRDLERRLGRMASAVEGRTARLAARPPRA